MKPRNKRMWRNWQTRWFQVPVKQFMWVQVPSSAPKNTAEKDTLFCTIFLSKSQTWYIIAARRISSRLRRVYHHRRCIPLRLDDILVQKRDILVFGRMICNFCEIDDIQGSRLDFNVRMWYNTLKEVILCQRIIC